MVQSKSWLSVTYPDTPEIERSASLSYHCLLPLKFHEQHPCPCVVFGKVCIFICETEVDSLKNIRAISKNEEMNEHLINFYLFSK